MIFGTIVRIDRDFSADIKAEDYFHIFDKDANKKGYRRVGPPVVRSGEDGNDFMLNMLSIIITGAFYKVPRIFNPIYKKV